MKVLEALVFAGALLGTVHPELSVQRQRGERSLGPKKKYSPGKLKLGVTVKRRDDETMGLLWGLYCSPPYL